MVTQTQEAGSVFWSLFDVILYSLFFVAVVGGLAWRRRSRGGGTSRSDRNGKDGTDRRE